MTNNKYCDAYERVFSRTSPCIMQCAECADMVRKIRYRDRRTSTNKQTTAKHKPTRCNCCKSECTKLHRVAMNTYYCPECHDLYKEWRKYNKGTTNK